MRRITNRSDLDQRKALIGHLLSGTVLAAVLAMTSILILASLSSGIPDVHVPADALSLFRDHPGLRHGEPYIAGLGPGWDRQVIGSVLAFSHVLALGITVFGLVKRRKPWAIAGIAWLVLMSLGGTPLTMMQPTPPLAVSAPVAREVLRTDLSKLSHEEREFKVDPIRYMQAQLAYIDGDRSTAAKLAAGLTSYDITSPMEGAGRLRYLQGGSVDPGACLTFGCLSRVGQDIVERLLAVLLALCAFTAAAALGTLRLLTARARRIDELMSARLKSVGS